MANFAVNVGGFHWSGELPELTVDSAGDYVWDGTHDNYDEAWDESTDPQWVREFITYALAVLHKVEFAKKAAEDAKVDAAAQVIYAETNITWDEWANAPEGTREVYRKIAREAAKAAHEAGE